MSTISHPIIIIELIDNRVEALYSNSELSFILVNHTNDNEDITVSGPHAPTLEKADLSKVIDGVTILNEVLERGSEEPFFTAKETPL